MVHIPDSEVWIRNTVIGGYGIFFIPLLKNIVWTHQIMGSDLFKYFYHKELHLSINIGTARSSIFSFQFFGHGFYCGGDTREVFIPSTAVLDSHFSISGTAER